MPQSFKPKLIRKVDKLPYEMDPNNPSFTDFDLVIAGHELISGNRHSSVYRSLNHGQSWYRVYFNTNPNTEIVDALEVIRQDRVYDSNGATTSAVHDQKTIAFLEFSQGSPNTYKILYQEHSGY